MGKEAERLVLSAVIMERKTHIQFRHLLPVVRRPVSVNPVLNFNPGFSSVCLKAFTQINISFVFSASNHQIVIKRVKLNLIVKLSYLNSNFALTLGYLNRAFNKLAQAKHD